MDDFCAKAYSSILGCNGLCFLKKDDDNEITCLSNYAEEIHFTSTWNDIFDKLEEQYPKDQTFYWLENIGDLELP